MGLTYYSVVEQAIQMALNPDIGQTVLRPFGMQCVRDDEAKEEKAGVGC